jgi:hypothetical protein
MGNLWKKFMVDIRDLLWYWPSLVWKVILRTALRMLAFFGLIYALVLGIAIILAVKNGEEIRWDAIFFPHYIDAILWMAGIMFVYGISVEIAREQRHLISLHDPLRYFLAKPYNPPDNIPNGIGIIVTNYNSDYHLGVYARIIALQEARKYIYKLGSLNDESDLAWRVGRNTTFGRGTLPPYDNRIFEIANWDMDGEVVWTVCGGSDILPKFDNAKEYIAHVQLLPYHDGSYVSGHRYCTYSYKIKYVKGKLRIEQYRGKSYEQEETEKIQTKTQEYYERKEKED